MASPFMTFYLQNRQAAADSEGAEDKGQLWPLLSIFL
jgi:hypothetical protein